MLKRLRAQVQVFTALILYAGFGESFVSARKKMPTWHDVQNAAMDTFIE